MNTESILNLSMKSSNEEDSASKIVGKNFKTLRLKAGLTDAGVAFALNISISYVLMIQRGEANISQRLAEEIASFYNIDFYALYSSKIIKLKPIIEVPKLAAFYSENKENAKFFIDRRSEYSVANFVRTILLKDEFLLEWREVGEILDYILKKHKRMIESQPMSRELRRAFEKGKLIRDDKFGNGSVYLFKLKD